MSALALPRKLAATAAAVSAAIAMSAPVLAADVVLQSGTNGCTGVLPSNDGNTDMRVVGGTQTPGGTAIFEITYPLNAASVGKQFTILDCAFINDVPALKYIVSFVPSNQSWPVLQLRQDDRQPDGRPGQSAQGRPGMLRHPSARTAADDIGPLHASGHRPGAVDWHDRGESAGQAADPAAEHGHGRSQRRPVARTPAWASGARRVGTLESDGRGGVAQW